MTVENTNSKSGPYDLDGSTLRFPRDFFLERPEHLQVFQVIDGVATLLTTGFTVTGIGSDEGEVIFSAEGYPVGGGVLMLKRNVPNTQETDYSNQARVKPEQVEIDLDKIVRQIQDLREVVDRSLHISIDQDLSDADLDRMSRAVIALGEIRDELEALYGKIPELQAVYDELDEVTLAGRNIEAIKAFSGSVLSLVDKSFVATGGQSAFQLDVMAFAPENVIVWLNKVRLVPDLDYTTDGSTLILSAGASAGDVVDTLTISAVSMEDVKRLRDEALDAANKIKEAAVMQQTTFLIEDGKRIYQLYKDGRPVSVWEYGVRLFIAPYGPLVERQDYHILPDGRIELHHDFDPGSLGIADFMVRYTDSDIQQIILGVKENADRAEAAEERASLFGPRTAEDIQTFLDLPETEAEQYATQTGQVYKGLPDGTPLAAPHIQAIDGRIVQVLRDGMRAYNIQAFGKSAFHEAFEYAALAAYQDSSDNQSWLRDRAAIFVPPGEYNLDDTAKIVGMSNMVIDMYGSVVVNNTDVPAFELTGSPSARVRGLAISMVGNNDAPEAVLIGGRSSYSSFDDLRIMGNSTKADFAAVRMIQGGVDGPAPTDRGAGNFWVSFNRPWVRKRAGADVGDFAMAFDLQGCQNAVRIVDGRLSNFTKAGVRVVNQGGVAASGISNDVQMHLTAFEAFPGADAFLAEIEGGHSISLAGGGMFQCRFESGGYVFNSQMTGLSVPMQIVGSTVISSMAGYANPSSQQTHWVSLDAAETPSGRKRWSNRGGLQLDSSGVGPALSLVPRAIATGGSIAFERYDGTRDGGISARSGGGLDFDGGALNRNRFGGVASISGTPTFGTNLRGGVAPTSGTSVSVTFPTAEPDASYRVIVTGNQDRKLWVTDKSASGFTINTDTAFVSGSAVDWIIIR